VATVSTGQVKGMPIAYKRDDERRLITATVSDPFTVDDILAAIDRQAAEDTWGYAMLYDLRAASEFPAEVDLQTMADRVKVVGEGRARGPVGVAIGTRPERFRLSLRYTQLIRTFATVEVLLTDSQLDDWLVRNARRGSTRQP
jgi:hypothetical protein